MRFQCRCVTNLSELGLEAAENGEGQGSEAEWQAAMERFAPLIELQANLPPREVPREKAPLFKALQSN